MCLTGRRGRALEDRERGREERRGKVKEGLWKGTGDRELGIAVVIIR